MDTIMYRTNSVIAPRAGLVEVSPDLDLKRLPVKQDASCDKIVHPISRYKHLHCAEQDITYLHC